MIMKQSHYFITLLVVFKAAKSIAGYADTVLPEDDPFKPLIDAYVSGTSSNEDIAKNLAPYLNPANVPRSTWQNVCFGAFLASGLQIGNSETFDSCYDDDSQFTIAETGTYKGLQNIKEYVEIFSNGVLYTSYKPQHPGTIIHFAGSNHSDNKCVATISQKRRLTVNPAYSMNGNEICIDVPSGAVLIYTPRFDPSTSLPTGILVKTHKVYFPKTASKELIEVLDPLPFARFVCNILLNECADFLPGEGKRRGCEKQLLSLPVSDEGTLNYLDGDSQGCRMIHASLAKRDRLHCPHITFAAEPDVHGDIKCAKSKGMLPTDLFAQWQLDLFEMSAIGGFGFDNNGELVEIFSDGCT